uniref:Chaperone DnaJ-domain superfamily protein n=1 Tax=Geranium maderense TaxID=28964 RepID=A0A0F7H1G5_9ROSI
MASTTTPHASPYPLLPRKTQQIIPITLTRRRRSKTSHGGGGGGGFRVWAAAPEGSGEADTRIHWENDEDGWIGGGASNKSDKSKRFSEEEEKQSLLGEKFVDLLNESSDSHYQFLGVSAGADMEEIKSAYRRLSKEYHPDTTSLPLKAASEKFMKLREAYATLSNAEKRSFYDWTLAQEAASRKTSKMRMKMTDPNEVDFAAYVKVSDRFDDRNLKLSDQAMSALTFDILIIIFSFCSLIYALYFKEQS